MRSTKVVIFFLLIGFISGMYAQSYSICGFIKDARTGEALIAAVVYDSTTQVSAISNEKGYFCIRVSEEVRQLSFSYLGYREAIRKITELKGGNIIIRMEPNLNVLKEIVVKAPPVYERTLSGTNSIPINTIKTLPSFTGEPDLLKAVTYLPGVSGGKEGQSALYVRGGSRDQNLILLDGATMYNVNHFGGFISLFNPEVLKKVDVYKGTFPARYGDRLSSVLDVRTKDGNRQYWDGNFNIGLVSSSLLLEGPVKKDKSSVLLAARSSYYGLLTLPAKIRINSGTPGDYYSISFYDINMKYSQQVGRTGSFYIHGYVGHDGSRYQEFIPENDHFDTRQKQQTFSGSIGYTRSVGNRGFMTTGLYWTRYAYRFVDTSFQQKIFGTDELIASDNRHSKSRLQELRWKTLFDFWLQKHHLKAGWELARFQYKFGQGFGYVNTARDFADPASVVVTDSLSVQLFSVAHRAGEAALFFEDEHNLSPRLKINVGLRGSIYRYLNKRTDYRSVEPRASVRMLVSKNASLKLGYAYVTQYTHLLLDRDEAFVRERWVSVTDEIEPQHVHQFSLGYFTRLGNIDLSTEAYYKKMNGLTASKPPLKYEPDLTRWEDFISTGGKGKSYGLEVLVEKNSGKFTGALAYTLSWTSRQFADLNFGRSFPFTYDRRHVLNVIGSFPIPSRKLKVSFNWTLQSGEAFSIPVGYIQTNPFFYGYLVYDGINNGRLPYYHRLDISLQRKWVGKSGRVKRFSLNIYNVYNRQNALSIYVDQNNKIKQISQFPIIPTISYGIQFSKNK